MSTASSVSDSVPIWLTLIRIELARPSLDAAASRAGLVTNRSSPTSWILSPSRSVSSFQPSKSSSAQPSSIETIGNAVDEAGQVVDHARLIEGLAFAGQHVAAVLEELGGGRVQPQPEVLAGLVAGRLARLDDEAQGLVGRGQVRGEAALVADVGVVAGRLAAPSSARGRSPRPCAGPRRRWARRSAGP